MFWPIPRNEDQGLDGKDREDACLSYEELAAVRGQSVVYLKVDVATIVVLVSRAAVEMIASRCRGCRFTCCVAVFLVLFPVSLTAFAVALR